MRITVLLAVLVFAFFSKTAVSAAVAKEEQNLCGASKLCLQLLLVHPPF
ncbi:hypothetical protein NU688_10075 [Variovorax sp. ZS18.2.2]|nr:hypothetical protein [Variovorax sp. ZS18.2.2]